MEDYMISLKLDKLHKDKVCKCKYWLWMHIKYFFFLELWIYLSTKLYSHILEVEQVHKAWKKINSINIRKPIHGAKQADRLWINVKSKLKAYKSSTHYEWNYVIMTSIFAYA